MPGREIYVLAIILITRLPIFYYFSYNTVMRIPLEKRSFEPRQYYTEIRVELGTFDSLDPGMTRYLSTYYDQRTGEFVGGIGSNRRLMAPARIMGKRISAGPNTGETVVCEISKVVENTVDPKTNSGSTYGEGQIIRSSPMMPDPVAVPFSFMIDDNHPACEITPINPHVRVVRPPMQSANSSPTA